MLRSISGDKPRGECLEAAWLPVLRNTLDIAMIPQPGFGPQDCCCLICTEGGSELSDSQSLRELSNAPMKVEARSLPDTYPSSVSALQQTWAELPLVKATCHISSQGPSASASRPPASKGRQTAHASPTACKEIAIAQGTTPGLMSEESCLCRHKCVLSVGSAYALLVHNGRGSM